MGIMDFHTHILPGIDDGSQNINMSLQMLEEEVKQQVEVVVATPHFYATHSKIDNFIANRTYAYDTLKNKMSSKCPTIKLGAEVAYFEGISRAEKLEMLTIEGMNAIMIEMPYVIWKDSYIDELKRIQDERNLKVILAHLNRYLDIKENKKYIRQFLESPYIIQINTGSLCDWKTKRKTLHMIHDNKNCILGSDCHGMNYRMPNLTQGREIIKKKLGEARLQEIDSFSQHLLGTDSERGNKCKKKRQYV